MENATSVDLTEKSQPTQRVQHSEGPLARQNQQADSLAVAQPLDLGCIGDGSRPIGDTGNRWLQDFIHRRQALISPIAQLIEREHGRRMGKRRGAEPPKLQQMRALTDAREQILGQGCGCMSLWSRGLR